MVEEEHHDVVVIGGGAAGLSCALECFDIQLDTIVLEAEGALGGQVAMIPHSIRNIAVSRFETGPDLERAIQQTATILGERVRLSHPVVGVDLGSRRLQAGGAWLSAEALVVATGSARRELPVAPDGGFGGDISYQLQDDPDRFAGHPVAVIGGGDSATLDALSLVETGSSVALVHRSELRARHDIVRQIHEEPRIEDLAGWELAAVHGEDRLEAIDLVRPGTDERRTLPVQGLIVKLGRAPRTGPFAEQLELDQYGGIVVDADLRTSRDGVFAAGDVVALAYPRVAAALGQGILAARSVLRHLEGRA